MVCIEDQKNGNRLHSRINLASERFRESGNLDVVNTQVGVIELGARLEGNAKAVLLGVAETCSDDHNRRHKLDRSDMAQLTPFRTDAAV